MIRGPGHELKGIIGALGITDRPGCHCNAVAAEMDALGVEGVLAQEDRFAEHLRKQAKLLGWREYVTVVRNALRMRLFLNPADPYPGLIREACRRANGHSS